MRLSMTAIRHRPPGAGEIALDRLSLMAGDAMLLLGPSGSGKSTLLAIAAGLRMPQHGAVAIDGQPLSALSAAARDRLRGQRVGLVFQRLHLVPSLTVAEPDAGRPNSAAARHSGSRLPAP